MSYHWLSPPQLLCQPPDPLRKSTDGRAHHLPLLEVLPGSEHYQKRIMCTVWLCLPLFDHPELLSLTVAEMCVSLFVKCCAFSVVLIAVAFQHLDALLLTLGTDMRSL